MIRLHRISVLLSSYIPSIPKLDPQFRYHIREFKLSDLTSSYRNTVVFTTTSSLAKIIFRDTQSVDSQASAGTDFVMELFKVVFSVAVLLLTESGAGNVCSPVFYKSTQYVCDFKDIGTIEDKLNVETLELRNQTEILECNTGLFRDFVNLKLLSVEDSSFKKVSKQCFEGLDNVWGVHFLKNQIEEFDLSGLNSKKLARLFLDRNNLENVDFSRLYFPTLVSLGLTKNKLTSLIVRSENVPKIGMIDAKENQISQIDVHGNFLNMLFLGYNKIESISSDQLKAKKLLVLGLNHNKIETISGDLFKNVPKLEKVDFVGNPVKKLDLKNSNITELNFYSNKIILSKPNELLINLNVSLITEIDFSFNQIMNFTLNNESRPWNLQELNLQGNAFTEIKGSYFKWWPKLVMIDLSMNKIRNIRTGALDNLPQLHTIRLSHNLLKTIPDTLFDLVSINSLDLSNNRLLYFPIPGWNEDLQKIELKNYHVSFQFGEIKRVLIFFLRFSRC